MLQTGKTWMIFALERSLFESTGWSMIDSSPLHPVIKWILSTTDWLNTPLATLSSCHTVIMVFASGFKTARSVTETPHFFLFIKSMPDSTIYDSKLWKHHCSFRTSAWGWMCLMIKWMKHFNCCVHFAVLKLLDDLNQLK